MRVSGSAPLSEESVRALAELGRLAYDQMGMSPEEVAEYERCKQSVIDARRSAERNEGQEMIG